VYKSSKQWHLFILLSYDLIIDIFVNNIIKILYKCSRITLNVDIILTVNFRFTFANRKLLQKSNAKSITILSVSIHS